MQPSFALELVEVASGWVRGAATLPGERLPVVASWFEDSPQQLLVAAMACLAGEEGRVLWVEEPDSKVWTLTPEADALRLLVQGCKGLGPQPGQEFTVISEETYVVPRRGFVVSVLAAFDALALVVPPERYEAEFRHPWPRSDMANLRRALGNPSRSHKR